MSNPDSERVFEAYNELFLTEGWKMLLEDFKKNQSDIGPRLMNGMPNIEYVYFEKGRNEVWNYCLGLQDFMKAARKQLEEESILDE